MRSSTPSPSLWSAAEVRFGVAVGLLFAATPVCQHLLPTSTGGLVLGTIAVGASLQLPARYAVGLGGSAWAFLTGFLVNAGGQLTFSGDDVRRALVLVSVAALASCAAALGRAEPVEVLSTYRRVAAGVR